MASSTFPNDITPPIAQTKKRGRPRFVARSTAEKVQERAQRLYSRQLDGQTTRQLVNVLSLLEGEEAYFLYLYPNLLYSSVLLYPNLAKQ